MRIGVSCYDRSAADLVDLVVAAEQAGFASVWLGEHVVAPVAYDSSHPTQPGSEGEHGTSLHNGKPIVDLSVEMLDPLVALAAAAARTTTIGLATGIYLLPLRHPLLTARAAATLSNLSGGRLRLGIGSGWLRAEFEALDVPFAGRTSRVEEAVAVLRLAWAGGPFEFHGAHYDFAPLQVAVERTAVPIVMGGNSEPALRRAVALADGWFSSGIPTFEQACRLRDRIEELSREVGRSEPLATTWRVESAEPQIIDRYAAAGFEELLVMQYDVWTGDSLDERTAGLQKAAAAIGLNGSET